jgi:hypothetical protein
MGKEGSKIFTTFPNSIPNMNLLLSTAGKEAALEMIGPHLEGGLTFTVYSGEAIDLPMNCIHKVWTTGGCFLVTMDFTTPNSIKAYSRIISTELGKLLVTALQVDLFDWFLTSLTIALENDRVYVALYVWIELVDSTTEWARENSGWAKEAKAVFDKFLSSPASLKQNCPCGMKISARDFRQHFREYHILSVSRKRYIDTTCKTNDRKRRRKQY